MKRSALRLLKVNIGNSAFVVCANNLSFTNSAFSHTLHVLSLVIPTTNGFYEPQQHKLFAIYHAKTVLPIK
jgi:hypothetical protein